MQAKVYSRFLRAVFAAPLLCAGLIGYRAYRAADGAQARLERGELQDAAVLIP